MLEKKKRERENGADEREQLSIEITAGKHVGINKVRLCVCREELVNI